MDRLTLGERLRRARDAVGMTHEQVGRGARLDEQQVVQLEAGERSLDALELGRVAQTVGRPLSYFTDADVPAVVSRRRQVKGTHASTAVLDIELQQFGSDLRRLIKLHLISDVRRGVALSLPRDHAAAESAAHKVRTALLLGEGPIGDLASVCERLGLFVFSAALGDGPDGACVEVTEEAVTVGAAVLNGDASPGRRRMTLAHELGHWLFGDAYDAAAGPDAERMINSFAAHLLAPRAGVLQLWRSEAERSPRDRAIFMAALFKLSWSAGLGHLRSLNLIDHRESEALAAQDPRSNDYVRLRLDFHEELGSPFVSAAFARACIDGYLSGRLTAERSLEMLRATLAESDLPSPDESSIRHGLRRSFVGHGG